jgi:hypothetical protein
MEASSYGLIVLLSRHMPGGPAKIYDKFHSKLSVSQPRFELGISRIKIRNVTDLTNFMVAKYVL